VQLLVYGPNIATARVQLDDHPGVTLTQVTEVANPNYAFVTLHVSDEAAPGTLTLRFTHPDGAFTRPFELRARDTTRTYAQGFSSEDVIYLMMPDRFANGDPSNDSFPDLLEGVDRSDPNARHGGESWVNTVPHEAYWQDDFRAHPDGYDSNLPSVTDFPMQFAIRDAFTQDVGWTTGIARLYYTLAQDHIYPEPNRLVTFLDNHDLTRFFTQVGEDRADFKMAYAFQMTTRGIPQVFYGTELMQPNLDVEGDGAKRFDMPGGWPDDPRSVFTEAGRTERENEAHDFVTRLTNWRKGKAVIHHGDLTQFVPEDNTYVYFRHDESETVMVVLNAADAPRTLALDRFQERIQGYTRGRDVITGTTIALDDALEVPAKTPLVLELAR